jgi:TonB-linked SusC/RagA family outer membrane protein
MKQLISTLCLMLFMVGATIAQRSVSGVVTGSDGDALIGASVRVKGTSRGTVTDLNGKYTVEAPAGATTLVFSYTGYETIEQALGASNSLDVVLAEGSLLEETVVTALGLTRDAKSVSYAVQQVNTDQIVGANETNMVNALSGKVAGLQVNASTGVAGGSSYFLIRGANSIDRNNQPLIVVDGIPIDNSQLRSGGSDDADVASVAYSNRAIDINPNDIESMSVLKGAAATAIYGSLAGNGAILITTKKGSKTDKVSIDFGQSVTFNTVNKLPELNTRYAQGTGGSYRAPSTRTSGSWGPLMDTLVYDASVSNMWDKNGSIVGQSANPTGKRVQAYDPYDFFRTGVASNTNFAVSKTTNGTSLRFSTAYTNETGIVPNNDFKRLNLGFNANTGFLANKVTLGVGAQYINSGGTRIEQGSNVSGVMLGLLRTTPTFDNSNGLSDAATNPAAYQFADGRPRAYRGLTTAGNSPYDNPYWTANNNPLTDKVNRIIGNVTATYSPKDWVTFTLRPGLDQYSDRRDQYFAIYSATASAGRVYEDEYNVTGISNDFIINLKPRLSEKITSNFILGHNLYGKKIDRVRTTGESLVIPGFYDLSNARSYNTFAQNSDVRTTGVYASADFGFNNWAYVNASGRVEQTSTFKADNNQYFYYSVGGSAIVSELLKLNPASKGLSFAKVRASYGLVGLGAPFASTDTYFAKNTLADGWTDGLVFPFNGTPGFSQGTVLGNPALEPEFRGSWEIGTDLRFLSNRIGLDLTYYQSRSTNVILDVPVAASSGFNFASLNSAELTNKGIEAILSLGLVQTKDFSWNILTNFTRNQNDVVKLAEGVDQVFLGGFTGASTRAVVGVPYGSIFGFGFYRDAANNLVIGSDGYPVLDPNEKAFGSALPDYQVGITNSFTYKGFTLSALLDVKQGGKLWNGTKGALYFFGMAKETADLRGTNKTFAGAVAQYDAEGNLVLEDHDRNPATPEIPKTSGANTKEVPLDQNWLSLGNGNGFFGDNTEDFVEDASWVRLRNVSLSYAVPASKLRSAKIAGLTFGISARNLWLSTKYTGVDPETNLLGAANAQGLDYFNMPNTKGVTASLNLNF